MSWRDTPSLMQVYERLRKRVARNGVDLLHIQPRVSAIYMLGVKDTLREISK